MMKKLRLPENCAAMWRVLGVVQGCISMAIVGGVFAFNAYADALKATFNLPQTDIAITATLANLGLSLAVPAGVMYEKLGLHLTSLCGLSMNFTVYILLWSSCSHVEFYTTHTYLLYIYFFFVGFSASFTYIVALVTNVHNYESSNRGTVVSIVEAAFSAGPSLLSLMYGVVFMHGELEHPERQNMGGFFLTMAILHVVVNASSLIVFRQPKQKGAMETTLDNSDSNESIIYSANSEEMRLVTDQSYKKDLSAAQSDAVCGIIWRRSHPIEADSTTDCRLLTKPMYHYILWPFICSASIHLTLFTNLTIYLRSFNQSEYNMTALVLVPAIGVTCKLLVGPLSDRLLDKCPRSISLLVLNTAQLLTLVPFIFYANNLFIYFLTIIITGASNGALWCLTPTILSEYFDKDHFGRNWGWTTFAGALFGSCAQALFGVFYEAQIQGDGINCNGLKCYYASSVMFTILAIAAVVGNVLMIRQEVKTKVW